jgi:hypothetical protein
MPPPINREPERRLSPFKWLLCCASIALGGLLTIYGYPYGSDGVSYVDMGDAAFCGSWSALLNGVWSPLFPFLLGLTRWILKPSMRWDLATVQLANFLIYVTTVLAFQFLWGEVLYLNRRVPEPTGEVGFVKFSDREFWILGTAIFLLVHSRSVSGTTPDMLLSTTVYLAAGLILRIRLKGPTLTRFFLLGVCLGLGFLTKAVMLPLGVVFLIVAAPSRQPRNLPYTLLAGLVFAGIASPYVIALSKTTGHFTVGEAGYLNYAWHVNGTPFVHWQGEPSELGKPVHPTREIFPSPRIYEFAGATRGTYPPWEDPSYWNEGLRARFDLAEERAALKKSLGEYLRAVRSQGVLVAGILVLLAMRRSRWAIAEEFLAGWYLWIPALAAFALYGAVWVEGRYVSPFLVLLWGAILTLVRVPEHENGRRLIPAVVTIVVALMSIQLAVNFARDIVQARKEAKLQMNIAEGLSARGVFPGEKVAVVDAELGDEWQKLLRVSVVAEIPYGEDHKFWAAPPAQRLQIYEALEKAGAQVLIAPTVPDGASTVGWERIREAPVYFYDLPKRAAQ